MLRSDPRIHYKMYKAKKNMVYATLFSFAVLGGLGLSQSAKADTVENNNVTPTVQTTATTSQSATSTQSSAAGMNAVNSAPTSQPTSAQPVVNSQANSASNVSNQTPTTTLNVQPVQPARNLAVVSRANLYAQNLTQTQSPVAEDTHFQFTDNTGKPISTIPTKDAGQATAIGLTGSFTANSTDFGPNKPDITLGTTSQSTTSGTNTHISLLWPMGGMPIKYEGQTIGHFALYPMDSEQTQWKLVCIPSAVPDATGKINVSFSIPSAIGLNHNTPAKWLEGAPFPQAYTVRLGDAQISLTLTAPSYRQLRPMTDDKSYLDGEYAYDSTAQAQQLQNGIQLPWLSSSVINQLNNSDGQQGNVPDSYQYGAHIVAQTPILQIRNVYGATALPIDPTTHKLMITSQEPLIYWRDDPLTRVADNLSISQLKNLNQHHSVISYQKDGSYNLWIYLSNDTLKATDSEWNGFANSTYYNLVNGQDPAQVAQATKHFYQDGALKGTPFQVVNQIDLDVADPTIKNHAQITYYNRNLQLVQNAPVNLDTLPIQLMAHGQAAVKLHVINATNGTELNQWRKLTNKA